MGNAYAYDWIYGQIFLWQITLEVSGMTTRSETTQAACPLDRSVRRGFETGDIVRVQMETYHGKLAGTLAEVLGVNEIGWPRIKYNSRNVETLPPSFLVLICRARVRST